MDILPPEVREKQNKPTVSTVSPHRVSLIGQDEMIKETLFRVTPARVIKTSFSAAQSENTGEYDRTVNGVGVSKRRKDG